MKLCHHRHFHRHPESHHRVEVDLVYLYEPVDQFEQPNKKTIITLKRMSKYNGFFNLSSDNILRVCENCFHHTDVCTIFDVVDCSVGKNVRQGYYYS